jgi:polysaccharide pyruvyl transferase WcaK-like protein
MKKITVLGNFSGRNAGDAAILGCLLKDIADLYPDSKFYIPTINTKFVSRSFGFYNIKPISLLPWTLSVKILGLPTLTSVLSSDLILVTDAILFDRKLYNPLFNYLWTLSKVLPLARKKGIPIVLYNSSLGPVTRPAGRKALQNVISSADQIILRDAESVELLEREDISFPTLHAGADCALNAQAVKESRFKEICKNEDLFNGGRPVIGFNVNSYIDAFVRKDGKTFGREKLVDLYAQTVDKTIENLSVDIIFVETQHMDMGIANEVLAKIKNQNNVRLVSNKKYSYNDICSVLQKLELFVGMRTHSLILSSAMGTPPVGIVTYPKNRGYMRTIGLEKNLIEFKDLSVDAYSALIASAFKNRHSIKEEMLPNVEREKEKARSAAKLLQKYFN